MTNTSKNTYKELAIPHFKEVFDIVDGVLTEHEVPFYLVGASAIGLELLKQGIDRTGVRRYFAIICKKRICESGGSLDHPPSRI